MEIIRVTFEDGNFAILEKDHGPNVIVANAYPKASNPVCRDGIWPGCDQCQRADCSVSCHDFIEGINE